MSVATPTVDSSTTSSITSLDQDAGVLDQLSTRPWGWCTRPRDERTNEVTGEVEQTRCDTNRCPGCAERRVYKIELAIVEASPTHWVTLTLAGTDWRAANKRWAALRRKLARRYEFQAAYVVEVGAAGDELHLHVLWRGDVPQVELLSESAQAVGLGRAVHLDRLFDVPGAAAYLTKQVREGLGSIHVEVNGGRLIHATTGFWTVDGEVVLGGWARVAKNLARRARRRSRGRPA